MNILPKMGADITPAIVGSLQCQKNSFLKEFKTIVTHCEEDKVEPGKSGKKKSKAVEEPVKKRYAVELGDTILFPEGGGQPSDQGYIVDSVGNKHFVEFIKRDKLRAVHLIEEPLEVGTSVTLKLDWKRRLDHMQQHTGQHLLSAVLDKYDLNTLSWSMGDMVNYIEIPRALSEEDVSKISDEVNEKIQEAIQITVETPGNDDVKQDKIPDDYDVEKGVLRVIKIGHLDQNPCCGTHLASTAQILSIALLHQTSVRGSNSRLHFLAGDRVRQYAVQNHKILKQSSSDLSCQFDDLSDKINQLNLNYRKSAKKEASWREEVAQYESLELIKQFESKNVVYKHRSDAGLDYLTLIFKNVSKEQPEGKVLILLSGDNKEGTGTMIINCSDATKTTEIAKHLQTLIPGLKGGGKAKWQGKISSFGMVELEAAIEYLKSL
jgi:misacylated tRNA(Ala) deacylase